TPTFTWEISFDGSNWNAISNSGPHKIYWTADAPIANPFQDSSGSTYSPLYDLALDKACGYVNGAADIRGGVTSGVSGDPQLYYNPGRPLPPGHPLTAYGQAAGFLCADYAYLLRGLLRSIGIDGTVKFMWAGPNSTTQRGYSLNNNPGLCQPGSPGTFCYSFRVLRPLKGDAPQNPHFSYHAAVYTNGLLYDAVYGDSYASPTFDETAFYNTPTQVQSSFYGFVQKTTFVCLHNQY
ncbi:MAG TPA: hypothetical protein VEF04_00240, partial [Blastocatellia bacterium]|nr:hypothetical protein [Blastocatellia bacterium]